jgi:hypothetical protein
LLEREARRFEFEQAKTKAGYEATDRQNAEISRGAIGEMYKLREKPILGPDGKPDQAATERKAYEWADIAMRHGPKDVRAEVDDALFFLSPDFMKKRLLQKYTQDFASSQLDRKLSNALQGIQLGITGRQGLQDDAQEFELQRLDKLYGLRMNELNAKAANTAKRLGQPPLTISPQLGRAILGEILRRERATGNKLTDEARFALMSEITELTQQTRDPYAAAQQRWNAKFPQARYTDAPTQPVPETDLDFGINAIMRAFGMTPTDTFLKPQGTPAPAGAPAEVVPGSLGEATTKNPFVTEDDEAALQGMSRDASRAETNRLPVQAEQAKQKADVKPTRRPPRIPRGTGPRTDAEKRKMLEAIFGK